MAISTSKTRAWLVAVFALAAAGCAMTSTFNQSNLSAARRPAAVQANGCALVVTAREDDAYVYSGHPTSFTGGATTLTLPLGSIVRESAVAAFADSFNGGADASDAINDAGRYVAIAMPKLTSVSYEYNSAKNVGFAISPTVSVVVDVRLVDAEGKTRWQRNYASGPVEATAYVINTSPEEEISKVTHKSVYEPFSAAAADVARGAPD